MGTRRTGLHHKREEKETSKMMLNGKSKVMMMTTGFENSQYVLEQVRSLQGRLLQVDGTDRGGESIP